MHIFICEDDSIQRKRLEKTISNYILSSNSGMSIALSTANPTALLEYLESHSVQSGLFFLDVDLQCDMNGIELGGKIRKIDHFATIVFITTHSEMTHLVFTHKVEALDYILKESPPDQIDMQIDECIQVAYRRFFEVRQTSVQNFEINIGKQVLSIPYDKIVYFESNVNMRNKLVLHTVDNMLDFRGHISDVAKLGSPFCMCHQSYVVNVSCIKSIDKTNRLLEMINGAVITVSRRRMQDILFHFYKLPTVK